ncbi:MAG: hypothetical protein OXT09_14530 [Myxococcales bacterium]|nr:hypothetical protein [Myxococcales bacterium]
MHSPRLASIALPCGVLLVLLLSACTTSDRCGVPGITSICACPGGAAGARVCSADQVWKPCDCGGAVGLPNPITARTMDGGMDDDPGTGGTGGTPGRPPADGPDAGPMMSDDDAGIGPMAGTGGAGGTGGTGGMAGAAGAAGNGPDPMEPYGPCMATADCGPDAECVVTPGLPANASVCVPACIDVGDCPVPDGTYEATPTCDNGYCKLDCTPVLFAAPLTCPADLVCIAPLFGISHCHN